MRIVDCSQRMEPHWLWETFPFVSQSYHRGDEFLEFGFKLRGGGFSFTSAPGWRVRGGRKLAEYPLDAFAGMAAVLDLPDPDATGTAAFASLLAEISSRSILVLRTGHPEAVHSRTPPYWSDAPCIPPEWAQAIRKAGFQHVALDLSCDHIPASRPEGGFTNPNCAFRQAVHAEGMLITENCCSLASLQQPETFFVALPIAITDSAVAPCRPISLDAWPSESPKLIDLSVPMFNHWRWKFDVQKGRSFEDSDDADEIHVLVTGHGFTHCDAPCHMRKGGETIQDLPNEGLDLFIGKACVVDLSDLPLPTPITRPLLEERVPPGFASGTRVILRSDLTNRVGYESREWHLKAPNLEREAAEFLVSLNPAAICLDFPQDFIAREMPYRHVYNHEFVAHHAVFAAGIPFVEDLRDLGKLASQSTFLLAVPLKTSCADGAPMRVLAVEW